MHHRRLDDTQRRIDLRPRDAQLGPEEAATLLGLTRAQVYRQLAEGIIPHKRVGKRYVIFRKDLDALSARAGGSDERARATSLEELVELVLSGKVEMTIRLRRITE